MPEGEARSPVRVAHDAGTLLRLIAEGVAAEKGEEFFRALVRSLATVLGVRHAFIAEFAPGRRDRMRTRACFSDGRFCDAIEFDLAGTPCKDVIGGHVGHHESGLQARFPMDRALVDWQAESYLGVPLFDSTGAVVGHVAVMDDRPMALEPEVARVMRIFAERARAELEDLRLAEALQKSERRYRDLYDEAPHAYVSTGTDGLFRAANRSAAQLLGVASPADLVGKPLFSFLADTPAGVPVARTIFARFLAGQETRDQEIQFRRADGRPVWVNLSVRPMRDETGAVAASRSILVDITDRKAAQEALARSEERLARVLGSAMDAIVTFDAARRIVLFNDAAETVFGCPRKDVLGEPVDSLLSPELSDQVRQRLGDLDAGGRPDAWLPPGSARRRDGRAFPVEGTLSHVGSGADRLCTLILRDIDERQQAERELKKLSRERAYLIQEIKETHDFEEIVGRSESLRALLHALDLVAPTDAPVLIQGETGTGKELIARAIHSRSARRDRPLIKVNCAALPTGLIESELFGHEKGAFTGAVAQRIGRFELADGGTLFLDEIGELPAEIQVKLLRVLQEQELERVGGAKTIKVDVRIIAATNRELQAAVRDGSFRADLFYRLGVFPLLVPPLRARRDDIPLLVHFFAARSAARIGRPIERVAAEAMDRLVAYAWPGNVRELANVIERAVILSADGTLDVPRALLPEVAAPRWTAPARSPAAPPTAPPNTRAPAPAASFDPGPGSGPGPGAAGRPASLEEVERGHILATLEEAAWVIEGPRGAARRLQLHPNTLRSRMKKLGIRRPTHEAS